MWAQIVIVVFSLWGLFDRMNCKGFRRSISLLWIFPVLLAAPSVLAASPDAAPAVPWHAQTIGQALGYMLLFAATGIAAAILGYKLFDLCTPGDLNKEIIENKNVENLLKSEFQSISSISVRSRRASVIQSRCSSSSGNTPTCRRTSAG